MLCLVIFGIKRYLDVALPHPIRLKKKGFTIIHNQTGKEYPLYIHTVESFKFDKFLSNETKECFLENALFLLDQDI
jgi:hypothetical protein